MDDLQKVLSDRFDRVFGLLDGLPDSASTRATTVRATTPLIGAADTYIVQTVRMREQGDTVFLEYVGGSGSIRMVLPPSVTEAIARQRDALSTKVRSKTSKAVMERRMAEGYKPTPPPAGSRRRKKKGGRK